MRKEPPPLPYAREGNLQTLPEKVMLATILMPTIDDAADPTDANGEPHAAEYELPLGSPHLALLLTSIGLEVWVVS